MKRITEKLIEEKTKKDKIMDEKMRENKTTQNICIKIQWVSRVLLCWEGVKELILCSSEQKA
jgi:hypothetical protein